ncbi:hypothetical protein [Nocardia sp. NPDC051570]|uniref:hypothetical protein n=1 Tax=Nocardia sp. NPDC051570 TaxID=3364324 RepID=UPI0037974E0D
MTSPADQFGCAACYSEDAQACWLHFQDRCRREHTLVDDSHFIVGLLRCPQCGQRFVSVFTEFIDWVGGEDPQYTTIMPLTEAEATTLIDGSRPIPAIGALGSDRRYLTRDWPSGEPPTLTWALGPFHVAEGH